MHILITQATPTDVPAITRLLNSSYRGEESNKGWTTEAKLIAGETRADEAMVSNTMLQPGNVFLKYTGSDGPIVSCVNLQQNGTKIYLGMFGVEPRLQGSGIGKQMLQAAENYALQVGCTSIYMTVITLRTELIAWYQRHGYVDTGIRIPFVEDAITGKHLQQLEFMELEKGL